MFFGVGIVEVDELGWLSQNCSTFFGTTLGMIVVVLSLRPDVQLTISLSVMLLFELIVNFVCYFCIVEPVWWRL